MPLALLRYERGMSQRALTTCNLCEANCGLVVEHDGKSVSSVRGDPDDPFSKGYICPKAAALADLHGDPDRLRRPLAKSPSGTWRELPWDEALDLVADRLSSIRAEHGPDAIATYLGNPTIHSHGAVLYGLVLLQALGTRNAFSSNSMDAWPRQLVSYLSYGSQVLLPIPDIDRTGHMWILGANPAVSNGSVMTAPGAKKRLQAIRARGGKVVVFDPRRTETARLADEHCFIRPDSDAYFLAAALHTIFAHDLAAPQRQAGWLRASNQLAELRDLVAPFSPQRVAPITGISADDITRLATDFAHAPAAVCYGRLGTCTQEYGALTTCLIDCLNFVTGNLDQPGGAMFAHPAIDLMRVAKLTGQNGSFGRWRSRVGEFAEVNGEFPAVAMAEEIETPGPGRIRALVIHAGNPVLSAPNGLRLDRALESLDFMVAIDIYRNETTRHADVILPPTFGLERAHYPLVFGALAVRNMAKYSPAVFAKPPGTRHDWEILLGLTKRLLARRGAVGKLGSAALGALLSAGPERLLRLGLRLGPYQLSLDQLLDNPHGIDLGPLEPRLPGALPRGEIDLIPGPIARDFARLRATLAELDSTAGDSPDARSSDARPELSELSADDSDLQWADGADSLQLIGRRQLTSNNSWMHNSPRLVKGSDRCTLLMHPDDAQARGIESGDRVAIASRVGTIEAPVKLSDEMMPGVVSLPHGWGHDRPDIQLQHAEGRPGVSVNDVTDENRFDAVSGCAHFALPVQVSRASG